MADSTVIRDHSPLAVLLDPGKDIPLGERDIRVDDYLADKIQTLADLGDLESLIASVESQKLQLEEQLQDARSELEMAKNASANHTSLMLEQTKEFDRQHANVQRRLMIVTSSDTPEEATRRLKSPMEKLRKLEIAEEYVELLKDVEALRNEARGHLPANPKEALKPYTQLKELSIRLQQLQEPAEGAAVHLVTHVQNTTTSLWLEMKKIMSDEFETVLQKSKWPDLNSELTRDWSDCFEKLLDLQSPEILAAREPLVLLPMSVLVKSFVQQFRYHFFSDKPTNHPHQLGDYFFEWFLGTVSKWEEFLRENIGPILAAHFRGNALAGNSLYVDPVSAFITALLPVMKEKVDIVVQQVSSEPQYLSRFMVQLMTFDDAIRRQFNYDAGNVECGWKGLTWDVLDTWFDRWAQVEKDFAMERYQEIMKTKDSSTIDYDSSGLGKTKPTYGAAMVTGLIQTVTLQYNKIRKFSHKLRFLINIQAEILDQYWGRLKDSLDIYQTITSTVGRTIHGITKEQQAALAGIGRLETLCKVFGSAEHVISMMKDWSNEEFFVVLWDELQARAQVTDIKSNLAGDMTYNEVRGCTSDAVGSEEGGSVFDHTIEIFTKLRQQAEVQISQAVKYSFPTTFKQYITRSQWTTIGDVPLSNSSSLNVTAELDQPLQALKDDLNFLRKTLADAPFRRIWREALDSLQHLLYSDVLLRQDFTTLGAARFMQDIAAIHTVIDAASGSKFRLGMPKLEEAVALLNLPLEADDDRMTLNTASHEIFANSKEAHAALEALNVNHLTLGEVRLVLARRVEINSD